MSELRRIAIQTAGYDCLHAPCKHNPRGNHGIDGGQWRFVVSTGSKAVSLLVLTSFYPDTVPVAHRVSGWPTVRHRITGALDFHRVGTDHTDCPFIDGGRCSHESGGYLICDEFAPLLGETLEPQSEEFWNKLEEILAAWRPEA